MTAPAQIEILRGQNPANPLAGYITELLAIEGYTYRRVDAPSANDRLLIVPHLRLTKEQLEIVRAHTGPLIALRPPPELADLFGVRVEQGQWSPALLRHPDGETLQVHGGADLYRVGDATCVAPLQQEFGVPGNHVAVARLGRRACFTYDLAKCCVLIQQGRPDQASDGPYRNADGDWKFTQNDHFVGHLDPRLKNVPQSDLHRDLLVRLIDGMLSVPRVGRFPNGETTGTLIDGDGDSSTAKTFELVFNTCEEFGIPYSTQIQASQFDQLPPAEVTRLRSRGHSVGLHLVLPEFCTLEECEQRFTRGFAEFADRYGYIPSATRNHLAIWVGWTYQPALESRIGVRIDFNGYPGRYFQSGVLSGTLLPAKFMDATGALVDIFSQYTVFADDGWVEPKNYLPALTEKERIVTSQRWVERCRQYQGMFHPTFHPIRLKEFGEPTLPWLRETLSYLRAQGVRAWSADAWAAFNDARRTIRIEADGDGWVVRAERDVPGATILLPGGKRVVLNLTAGKPRRLSSI